MALGFWTFSMLVVSASTHAIVMNNFATVSLAAAVGSSAQWNED